MEKMLSARDLPLLQRFFRLFTTVRSVLALVNFFKVNVHN